MERHSTDYQATLVICSEQHHFRSWLRRASATTTIELIGRERKGLGLSYTGPPIPSM